MPRISSLSAFLATAKKALTTTSTERQLPLTLVVGNESADLDSLCSALLLAYFRTSAPPHTLHVPLANLPRADLDLRPELAAVLGRAGLRAADLLTLSDLPDHLAPEHTRWLLVDHNALTGSLLARQYAARVFGCVDHHEDEGTVPSDVEGAPRVIEKSGSCMSLVVQQCRSAWETLAREEPRVGAEQEKRPVLLSELAYVALGPVLIDTVNLTSKDKTTELDVQAAAFAETFLRDTSYERTAYFDELTRLKEDLSGMSHRDILRKDYKRWTDGGLSLGISMVVQGFEFLLEKVGNREQFLAELQRWAKEQELDIAVVMTISKSDGPFSRQLLVWALNPDAVRVASQFVAKNGNELGLETWGQGQLDETGSDATWRMCWKQGNAACSRKQVAPMIRDTMKAASGP